MTGNRYYKPDGTTVRTAAPNDADQKRVRKLACKRERVWLWTEKDAFFFTPVLSEVVYGDGKAVFGFTTCHDRPEYWVVRGDSRWLEDRRNEKGWMMEGNDIIKESIDYILENLAIEFGNAVDQDDEDTGRRSPYPSILIQDGYSWFELWRVNKALADANESEERKRA